MNSENDESKFSKRRLAVDQTEEEVIDSHLFVEALALIFSKIWEPDGIPIEEKVLFLINFLGHLRNSAS